MKTAIKTMAVAVALFGLAYLGAQTIRQSELLKNSCVSVQDVQIKNASVSDLWVGLNLKIINKTSINITVFNQNLVFYLGNQYLGFINQKTEIKILAGGQSIIPMEFHLAPMGLIKSINDFSSKLLTIQGSMGISTSVLLVNKIPINMQIKFVNLFGANQSTIQC